MSWEPTREQAVRLRRVWEDTDCSTSVEEWQIVLQHIHANPELAGLAPTALPTREMTVRKFEGNLGCIINQKKGGIAKPTLREIAEAYIGVTIVDDPPPVEPDYTEERYLYEIIGWEPHPTIPDIVKKIIESDFRKHAGGE